MSNTPNIRNIFAPSPAVGDAPAPEKARPPALRDEEQAERDAEAGDVVPMKVTPDVLVGMLLVKAGMKADLVEAFLAAHVGMKGAALRSTGSLITSNLAELPPGYVVGAAPKAVDIEAYAKHYSFVALTNALKLRMPGRAEYWLPSYAPWLFLDNMRTRIVEATLTMRGEVPGITARVRLHAGEDAEVWVPDPLGAQPEDLEKLVEFYNLHSGNTAILGSTWIEEVAMLLQTIYPMKQSVVKNDTSIRIVPMAPSEIALAQKGLPDCLYVADKLLGRTLHPNLVNLLNWFARHLRDVYMPVGKPFEPQVYIAMQMSEQFDTDSEESKEARAIHKRFWPTIANLVAEHFKTRCATPAYVRAAAAFEAVDGDFSARNAMYPGVVTKKDDFTIKELRDYVPPLVIQHLAEKRAFRALGSRDALSEDLTHVGVTGGLPLAQLGELATCLYHVGWKVGKSLSVHGPSVAQLTALQAANSRLYGDIAGAYAGISIAPAAVGTAAFKDSFDETFAYLSADPSTGNNTSSAQAGARCSWAMNLNNQMVAANVIAADTRVKHLVFGTFLPYEEMSHTFLKDNLVWGPLLEHFDMEIFMSGKLHSDRLFLVGTRRASKASLVQLEHWYRSRLFFAGAIIRTANDHATLALCAGGVRHVPVNGFTFQKLLAQATSYAAAAIRAVGFQLRTMPLDVKSLKLLTTTEQGGATWLKPYTPLEMAPPLAAVRDPRTVTAPSPVAARALQSVVSGNWFEQTGDTLTDMAMRVSVDDVKAHLATRELELSGLEAIVASQPTAQAIRSVHALRDIVDRLRDVVINSKMK